VRSAAPLAGFLDRTRIVVDEALERYLSCRSDSPAVVIEAMRYSLFAGGKRLRPVLALAAADAVARRDHLPLEQAQRLALPAACAIELIHTYSLIHDDLPAMDDDTLRRGRPTSHVVYGEGLAILAGDGLHSEAFSLLAREPEGDDPDLLTRKLRVLRIVADAAGPAGMVGGQALDLHAAGQVIGSDLSLDAAGLQAMHARKTGALIRASAVSGAVMAGAAPDAIAAIDEYAADLGLAFQIVDDILDVEGNPQELGKTAGKDAVQAKPTYPSIFGVERSRELAQECVAHADHVLGRARFDDGWLGAIAAWVIARRN
jgi:geranylgeranyl diphosphate synthase, type II